MRSLCAAATAAAAAAHAPPAELLRLHAFASAARVPCLEPLSLLAPVLDREAAARLLEGLPARLAGVPLAAPAWTRLEPTRAESGVAEALAAAKITTPCLLKPLAACGAPGAHVMELLLRASDVTLPAPCIAQAFVPHWPPTVHKAYVFGDAVLVDARASLPPPPAAAAEASLRFDALRALPREWPGGGAAACEQAASPPLSLAAVRAIADWLRERTGLWLFGFDLLVAAPGGEHCVVDLNAFPTAAGVAGAPEALAAALRARADAGKLST